MATNYSRAALQVVVAQVAEATGFDTMQQSALEVLSDLLLQYVGSIGNAAHGYAELANRTGPTADDLLLAFKDLGIKLEDIVAYTDAQEEAPFALTMPPYPVQRNSKWPPTFVQREEKPPAHIPEWLPALPDQHTYVSTPALAGHDADARRQRLAESKAKRQAEKALVRLSERMGEGPSGAKAGPSIVGGNPFLAPPTWEASSAVGATCAAAAATSAARAQPGTAATQPDGGAAALDTDMPDAADTGSLADAFAAAAEGQQQADGSTQPTGTWSEAAQTDGGTAADALGGAIPAFAQDWGSISTSRLPNPAYREEEDAFAAAEVAAAAAAAAERARGGRKASSKSRSTVRGGDAAAGRAKEILAAGADAVLMMGEGRDGPGGGSYAAEQL